MLNHIVIMGRLTRDPELRYTGSNIPVASFSVAVDRDFGKGENGELLFKCKALNDDGSCGVYKFRSVNCRLYPKINQKFVYDGGKPLDGCGYKFSVNKKFRDYLKK